MLEQPLDEQKVLAGVADCMAQGGIIGASNRSLPGFDTTRRLPAWRDLR